MWVVNTEWNLKYYYYCYVASPPLQAALKGIISLGGQKKRKNRKTRKSRSEEKAVAFSSASLFPARKREAITQGGTMKLGG